VRSERGINDDDDDDDDNNNNNNNKQNYTYAVDFANFRGEFGSKI
jgi:hypothetical protein